jgi:hypothetical protein
MNRRYISYCLLAASITAAFGQEQAPSTRVRLVH